MTRHGTAIPWTHAPGYGGKVWNPVVGCTRVSAGCDHCYAFALHDRRYKVNLADARTAGAKPSGRGLSPQEMMRRAGAPLPFPPQYDQPFSKVQLLPDRLDIPLHWRKPRCIFVCSMSDLFHEQVDDYFIRRVFGVMAQAPRHRFLILTKRPERMRELLNKLVISGRIWPQPWPLPNVWLGVSVEDQATADERIPLLLDTPAAVRFVSAEPLLGPVDLTCVRDYEHEIVHDVAKGWRWTSPRDGGHSYGGLDWLIVGGESGPGHRPMDIAWVESLKAQCDAARVPMFGKQAAGPRPDMALPGRLAERSWPL